MANPYIDKVSSTVSFFAKKCKKLVSLLRRQKTLTLFLLLIIVFFVYIILNWQFVGPTYLSDEMGYLSKAIALAGSKVDHASSWYVGYSLFIFPVFIVFSDPTTIWHSIIILNSLMFVVSLGVLYLILKQLMPRKNFWGYLAAIIGAAIYPTWAIMAGYSFATPAFTLIFTLLVWRSLSLNFSSVRTFILPALLVGFLPIIHPIGLPILVAAVITVLVGAFYNRKFKGVLLFSIISISLTLAYVLYFHSRLNSIMTPLGALPFDNHYSNSLLLHLKSLLGFKAMGRVILTTMGHLSYLLVATLGIIYFGIEYSIKKIYRLIRSKRAPSQRDLTLLFMLLSLAGAIALSVFQMNMSIVKGVRSDTLIYGRYIEMMLLPILGLSILSTWKKSRLVIVALFVAITGILAYNLLPSTGYNNFINTISFWPAYIISGVNFLNWMLVGAIGILAAGSFSKKSYLFILAVPIALLCIYSQIQLHDRKYKMDARPTGLVQYVKDNYSNTCIGQDNILFAKDIRYRIAKYQYYLADYSPSRMDPDKWLNSGCDLYLTSNYGQFKNAKNVEVVGESNEYVLSLYLLQKTNSAKQPKTTKQYDNFYTVGNYGGSKCVLSGCFTETAQEMMLLSEVGSLKDGFIETTDTSGALFIKQHLGVRAGQYKIILNGDFKDLNGAGISLARNENTSVGVQTKYYMSEPLSKYLRDDGSIIIPLELDTDLNNSFIRLSVTDKTNLTLKQYQVVLR